MVIQHAVWESDREREKKYREHNDSTGQKRRVMFFSSVCVRACVRLRERERESGVLNEFTAVHKRED